jgi:CNH domain
VTQISVIEEFSLFLVLTDKALVAYHLDVISPISGQPPGSGGDSARRSPQRLSGARDVGFFVTGRMKDRALVFYKKKDGLSSTFKVLEPVYQKATEKKSRLAAFGRKGTTEFFREFDEFYIPTECFSINLFASSLAISTLRGFEVLTLDKKQPWSVPDLKQSHVSVIAARLKELKPLGMFKLSETEFLLCYEECAVYVSKHGEVSRSVIMEFVGKATAAAIIGPYVLLFDKDFVEVRNAQNGRLRQVIAGKDVRCLDDAQTGERANQRTIKLALAHPEMEGRQIVVELLLNEGQRD